MTRDKIKEDIERGETIKSICEKYSLGSIVLNCTECDKEFSKIYSQIKRTKSDNHFCSQSCAAKFNNKTHPKRQLENNTCRKCNKPLNRTSYKDKRTVCSDCNPAVDWSTVTFGELKGRYKYQKSSRVRALARNAYLNSGLPQYCINCGYDKHFEVCHIKGIATYSDEALVTEINCMSNLLALCKNCHWEFDQGMLSLDQIGSHIIDEWVVEE